ncbi:hypothetical protein UFOVP321_11 [uncultured Caudovirales phage]|uniref:Uncharacterized protein n=1 Tax=uncultured Caudovirales phage TaxID=2100421 RepID=A0A6J5LVR7_9CAUD|nr:hypothetical protein UFOVP321_11 [uncultured Caudovirales phage]
MAEEIIGVKVKVDAGDVGKSVGSLKQQLREAQNEVNTLSEKFGATSKEAINAAKRAAELKDAIGDAKALTDAFNPDAKFKALTASLSGVAGGFAAVQGAIGLFGAESEEVEKTLLKVQSAMAFSQGIQAIGESVDSFKQLGAVIQSTTAFQKINNTVTALTGTVMKTLGFAVETTSTSFRVLKGAIAATGIGLLVVAVGELVNAFQDYQSAAEKAKKAQDDLNKSIGESAKVGLEAEMQFLDNQKQIDIAKAKNKNASEKEIFDIEQKYRKIKGNAQVRYWNEIKNVDKEGAANALKEVDKINTEGTVARLDFDTKQREKRREEAKKAKDEAEKEAKELLQKQTEGREKARKAGEEFDLLVLNNNEKKKEQAAKDEEKRIEDDNKEVERLFELEEKKLQVITDASNKKIALENKIADEELKAKEALENAKYQAAVAGLNLLFALAGQNEQVANALFVVDKALAVARIVVDTQKEIAGYASNPLWTALPDGGLAIKSKFALAAKIRAGASIASIAATTIGKFKNGSAPQQSGGNIGGVAPIALSAPQAQLTQLNQASINQMGSATGRAYVVESDITNQQEKIIRINRAARLG